MHYLKTILESDLLLASADPLLQVLNGRLLLTTLILILGLSNLNCLILLTVLIPLLQETLPTYQSTLLRLLECLLRILELNSQVLSLSLSSLDLPLQLLHLLDELPLLHLCLTDMGVALILGFHILLALVEQ